MKKILFLLLIPPVFFLCCGKSESDIIDEFEKEIIDINPDVPIYCDL